MSTWIRFRYDNGDSALIQASEAWFLFKAEEQRVEVYSNGSSAEEAPIFVYSVELPEHVAAAEDLIYDAIQREQSLVITLDLLDEHAEYSNHIQALRMVLQLLHQGSIRIPKEDGLSDDEVFELDDLQGPSEISRFEEMLSTYLEVPSDNLRRSMQALADSPFSLHKDHEECPDHGFHEYWVVETRPDHHYALRQKYDDLARTLMEKEGLGWQSKGHHA